MTPSAFLMKMLSIFNLCCYIRRMVKKLGCHIFANAHSLTHAQINTYISTQKLTKPFTKHIKLQLQGLSCSSKESSPAHCVLPFVGCETQNQRVLTCTGSTRQACGESCSDSKPWLPCHAEIPPPAPRSAPLFPHLINLSAKPFDMRHNMVPVFLSSGSSLPIWFQHFKISQLTHKGLLPWCLRTTRGSRQQI